MLAWITWACIATGGADDSASPAVDLAAPSFLALGWVCSAEDDTWTFSAEASAWTAGAELGLSLDGSYIEEHDLKSQESAADGSWDRLGVTLIIVADPRDQARSVSTAYLCDQPTQTDLALRMALLAPDSAEEADCRVTGAALDWESLGYAACQTRWETE
jgi:hypothetical protein